MAIFVYEIFLSGKLQVETWLNIVEYKGEKTVKFKAVFHVNSDTAVPLQTAFGNIQNLLKEREVIERGAEIVLLLNGPGILRLKKDADINDLDNAKMLSEKGVKFQICNNSLVKFGLSIDGMHPSCEVVPAGVMALIKLQADGYAYIKP